MMAAPIGTTRWVSEGVVTERPSIADMDRDGRSDDAVTVEERGAQDTEQGITSPNRLPPGRTAVRARAARAMTPPSPSLSARRMNTTYFTDTTRVIDQKTREMTP